MTIAEELAAARARRESAPVTPRRYRLVVGDPEGMDDDDDPSAVIECSTCGEQLLCDSDEEAEAFAAALLQAIPCGCEGHDGA